MRLTGAAPSAPATAANNALHTARLHLEPLTEAHCVEMYDALQDERMYAFIPDRRPGDRAAVSRGLRRGR
jgi:hypothetical protein